MKFNHVLMLIMMIFQFEEVNPIQCYQCRSDTQGDCSDFKLKRDYLKDCDFEPSLHDKIVCRKIDQHLNYPNYEVFAIIRECAYLHMDSMSCYKSPWKDTEMITCECDTEGCNKGYSLLRTLPTCILFLCICFSVMFL